jgi:adenylate kinase
MREARSHIPLCGEAILGMPMRILITGTPGTGKSSVAREISKRKGWPLLSLKEIAEKRGCIIRKEGKERIVDAEKLRKEALRELKGKKDAVIEGHLGCEFSLPVDFVFILRARPAELRRRMGRRGYNSRKIEENLMAEMLDYCSQVSARHYKVPILEADTTKRTAGQTARRILSCLGKKVKKLDNVGWEKELREAVLSF